MNTTRKIVLLLLVMLAMSGMIWANGDGEDEAAAAGGSDEVLVAYCTNGPYTFWTFAHAGVKKAEQEFEGLKVEFYKPPSATVEEQKRFIENMMATGVDGLAISVIDPENMTPFLNEIGAQIPMVMFDSDAPESNRKAYVGMSNYAAGRMAGEAIMHELPDGGELIIFVGRLDAQNAVERRQGIIDELDGEPYVAQYPGEMTPNKGPIKVGKWTILDTRTDGGDASRAKSNVEDMLAKYNETDLMIGLWGYNTPGILAALGDAGLLGTMKVVGFDEEMVVLDAVEAGHAYGTIVQNPYEYGRTSVELLYKLIKGEDAGIPADMLYAVPARLILADMVPEFKETLKKQLAVGEFYEAGW
jgi:ribose transport system substrate-binding protein